MMQLKNLHIKSYKNFIDTELDFSDSTHYCAFIGLNASGKSNLLEAISKIFAGLYRLKKIEFKPDFEYTIQYSINNFEIEIELRKNPSEWTYYFKVDDLPKTKALFEQNISQYAPTKVIANYSGEELRLWENIYSTFYEDYLKNIKKNIIPVNQMNYINKYNWDLALISLLCLNDSYIKDLLDISDIRHVNVKFDFDPAKYSHYGANPVIAFFDEINPRRRNSETIDMLTIQSNTVLSSEADLTKRYINLFNFLYLAYMPKGKKLLKSIEIQFNGITTKLLSEGQKKIILVRFITEFLSDENTLMLFDEPDSHIHVSRKEELANMISRSSAYSVLTSHSPALINFINENCVQLLKPHNTKGIEAIKLEKLKQIESITENSMSIMDTSLIISTKKHILMCEGVNDLNYIKKAIEVLSRTKDPKYLKLNEIVMMNCGGADNVKAVFEEIIRDNLKESQKCIVIFDDDKPGRDNRDKIQKIITDNHLANVKTLTHPKIDSSINGEFYMEDYFSIDAYKSIIQIKLNDSTNFKSLESLQKAKSIIQDKYLTFSDANFDNFSVLLDELLSLFGIADGI